MHTSGCQEKAWVWKYIFCSSGMIFQYPDISTEEYVHTFWIIVLKCCGGDANISTQGNQYQKTLLYPCTELPSSV